MMPNEIFDEITYSDYFWIKLINKEYNNNIIIEFTFYECKIKLKILKRVRTILLN